MDQKVTNTFAALLGTIHVERTQIQETAVVVRSEEPSSWFNVERDSQAL